MVRRSRALETQQKFHEAKASELKGGDPAAIKSESLKIDMNPHQLKLYESVKAEYAKVDPNSRYGKALGERMRQLKSTPA